MWREAGGGEIGALVGGGGGWRGGGSKRGVGGYWGEVGRGSRYGASGRGLCGGGVRRLLPSRRVGLRVGGRGWLKLGAKRGERFRGALLAILEWS